jgi:hypothetical protein
MKFEFLFRVANVLTKEQRKQKNVISFPLFLC